MSSGLAGGRVRSMGSDLTTIGETRTMRLERGGTRSATAARLERSCYKHNNGKRVRWLQPGQWWGTNNEVCALSSFVDTSFCCSLCLVLILFFWFLFV
jgi:hypothetical protein